MSILKSIQNYFDKRLAKKLVRRLYKIDVDKWLGIERQFNNWKFPMEFYDLMPHWYVNDAYLNPRAMVIMSPIIKVIQEKVGRKEELRYHNVFKGKMTNDEFEYWWGMGLDCCAKTVYHLRSFEVETIKWWEDEVYQKLVDGGLVKQIQNKEHELSKSI